MVHEPKLCAALYEPDVDGCDPNEKWFVRQRRDELSGTCEIEFKIPRRDNSRVKIRMSAADRGSLKSVSSLLLSYDARLPESRTEALQFVGDLIRATPTEAVISTHKPGWRDDACGCVMSTRMYGTAKGRYVWDAEQVSADMGAIRGTLERYTLSVLEPAKQSTHLTTAILIPLAAMLNGYVLGRLGHALIPETACFHFFGDTSTGKSTLGRVAQSVIGSPQVIADYRISGRGLAEAAYSHNDLCLVVDEAEHTNSDEELWKKTKEICQGVTEGRSRQVTRAARATSPLLRWTSFGVSTGPISQASVSLELNKLRRGLAARFIEFAIDDEKEGGIFDELVPVVGGSTQMTAAAALVRRVELGIAKNHGVLLDRWITYLLTNDVAEKIERLVERFARDLSGVEGGLTGRLARKFALLYAAARIAIEAGLLPWSEAWVRYAITSAYRNALAVRDPATSILDRAVLRLEQAVKDRGRFPIVSSTRRGVPRFQWDIGMLGVVVDDGQKSIGYLVPDRLSALGVTDIEMQRRIAREIYAPDPTSHSSDARQFWVDADQYDRIRAWRFTRSSLFAAVTKARANSSILQRPNS